MVRGTGMLKCRIMGSVIPVCKTASVVKIGNFLLSLIIGGDYNEKHVYIDCDANLYCYRLSKG